MITKRKK